MWYAKSQARKSETPADKKLREAEGVIKWMPYLLAVVLIIFVCQCIALAKHPGMEHLLNLVAPVGLTLYLLSHWLKANTILKGTSETWHMGVFLLGAVLMASGPTLKDMWHHGQMVLFHIFGGAVLAVALFSLIITLLDVTGFWGLLARK